MAAKLAGQMEGMHADRARDFGERKTSTEIRLDILARPIQPGRRRVRGRRFGAYGFGDHLQNEALDGQCRSIIREAQLAIGPKGKQ